MSVLQLQQLDGPLDVRQPARTQLDVALRVDAPRHPLGLHPRLEPPDLVHLLRRHASARIADGVDDLDETTTELLVTRAGIGAQESLRFPCRRPPSVVPAVSGQGAHQRAFLALRPQIGVEPQRSVLAAQLQQGAQPGHDRDRALHPFGIVGVVDDEHAVGVRRVRHLARAPAATRDHRDLGRIGDLASGDLQHRADSAVDDVRKAPAHDLSGGVPEQIRHGQPQQLASPDRLDRLDRRFGLAVP